MAYSSNLINTNGAITFGIVQPVVTGQESDNDSYMVTSDGTSAGNPISFWKFDGETSIWVFVSGVIMGSCGNYDTLTPITFAADQHNLAYNPLGYRITVSGNQDLTGIQAQPNGSLITLFNVGPNDIKLKNNNANSLIVNRLFMVNGGDVDFRNNSSVCLRYDVLLNSGNGAWHLLGVPA